MRTKAQPVPTRLFAVKPLHTSNTPAVERRTPYLVVDGVAHHKFWPRPNVITVHQIRRNPFQGFNQLLSVRSEMRKKQSCAADM